MPPQTVKKPIFKLRTGPAQQAKPAHWEKKPFPVAPPKQPPEGLVCTANRIESFYLRKFVVQIGCRPALAVLHEEKGKGQGLLESHSTCEVVSLWGGPQSKLLRTELGSLFKRASYSRLFLLLPQPRSGRTEAEPVAFLKRWGGTPMPPVQ